MEINKNITDKIKKLLALGQSPNEHEAKLAIENAHKFLIKYNLTMGDVSEKAVEVGEQTIEEVRIACSWKSGLLHVIAEFNFGMAIIIRSRGTVKYTILAKEHNFVIIKNMYEYLVDAINNLADKYEGRGRTAKNSFRLGVVNGIHEKLREMKNEQNRHGMTVDGEQISALMIINSYEQEQKAIKAYVQQSSIKLTSSKTKSRVSGEDYSNGRIAAKRINLNAQIK